MQTVPELLGGWTDESCTCISNMFYICMLGPEGEEKSEKEEEIHLYIDFFILLLHIYIYSNNRPRNNNETQRRDIR
jgi:hypothetical protein